MQKGEQLITRRQRKIDRNTLRFSIAGILIFGLLSILLLPFLFNLPAPKSLMAFNEKTSNVSNTINGISAPFIAFGSAVLTFLAFWIQYKANQQQKAIFRAELRKKIEDDKAREKTWRIERFESRFYELLKLHKANVDEMSAGRNLRGRKLFTPMFYEFRFLYSFAELTIQENSYIKDRLPKEFNLMTFSYTLFFHGIGPNSQASYENKFSEAERELLLIVKEFADKYQRMYRLQRDKHPDRSYFKLNVPIAGKEDKFTLNVYYTPFDGHISRLGHYYRHLFQTAKFIIRQPDINKDEDVVYDYIKIIRAQLSDFEQLMLYYNAISWYDTEWRELLTDYRLIKNLPLGLADFGVRPEAYFDSDIDRLRKKGKEMFQWHEE